MTPQSFGFDSNHMSAAINANVFFFVSVGSLVKKI
jgi:hypothetical protein